MNFTPSMSSEREQRFQEIVAGYLDDLEADRAEDLPSFLSHHPDLAEEIAAFFTHQDQVARLTAPLRQLAKAGGGGVGRPAPSAGEDRSLLTVGPCR